MDKTKVYNTEEFNNTCIELVIKEVSLLLKEKGYDPIDQIVGYLMSGDPGYISGYKDARSKLTEFERAKLLEIVVAAYLK